MNAIGKFQEGRTNHRYVKLNSDPELHDRATSEMTDTNYNEDYSSNDDNDDLLLVKEHKISCLPIRYLIAVLSFSGFCNVYAMRVNLSVALVDMVSVRNITTSNVSKSVQDFDWGTEKQGILLSAFFWGYIVTQLPGGLIASKYGGKKVFCFGIFSTSIFTLFTPLCVQYGGFYFLLVIRILEGLCEGVTYPAMHAIWSKWAPRLERTKLISISICGSYAGTVVSMPLGGIIAYNFGWEWIFYSFGIVGLLWTLLWITMASETPEDHPWISRKEVNHIKNSRGSTSSFIDFSEIPWGDIFTSAPVYAIIVVHFCENWGFYTLLTELPTYMKDVLHFKMENSGILSALPYLVLTIIVLSSGQVADFLRSREHLSTTQVRKLYVVVGYSGQMIFLTLVGYAMSSTTAVIYLTLAVGLGGLAISAYNVNHLDISPKYASILMGISNTVATVPGIVSPTLTGFITHNRTQMEWRIVFYIASGIYGFGGIIYALFSSGTTQHWG